MTHPPTAPIGLDAANARAWWSTPTVTVDEATLGSMRATGAEVDVTHASRAESSRDWWPLVMTRAASGEVGQLASAVVRPTSASQVSAVDAAE